jgi:hypothetical protein
MRIPRIVLHGQLLFRLVGPWSGICPQLAVTLLSDTRPWAEHGVNHHDVCSRVFIFLRYEPGYFKQCLYKFT